MLVPMHVIHTIPYCIYSLLPEDESTYWKHVQDINIKDENINFENVHFVGLCCIIIRTLS